MLQLILSLMLFICVANVIITLSKIDIKKSFWVNKILRSTRLDLCIDTDFFMLVHPKASVSVSVKECLLVTTNGVYDVSEYGQEFAKKGELLYNKGGFLDMREDQIQVEQQSKHERSDKCEPRQ